MNLTPTPKLAYWGPKKAKKGPKIRSKSKVRIEWSIENQSCLSIWVDLKNFFEPYPNPKISLLGPQKCQKKGPKIRSKSKVRIEGSIENQSCWSTWVESKNVFEPYPNRKNSPKVRSKSKVRIEGSLENRSCSALWVERIFILLNTDLYVE